LKTLVFLVYKPVQFPS